MTPSDAVSDGRNTKGQFTKGNTEAKGNPYARRVGQLRAALLDAVSEDDVRDVIQAMIRKAVDGDTAAARILLDRCLGPSESLDVIERIEALEQAVDS